ncbi:MAG: hypothetical protein AAF403_04285, partial [Pseudomonadota bacterium]
MRASTKLPLLKAIKLAYHLVLKNRLDDAENLCCELEQKHGKHHILCQILGYIAHKKGNLVA